MNLKKACLRHAVLREDAIQNIYDQCSIHKEQAELIKLLCLSHERLRAELAGAEILLNEQHCPHCGPHCDLLPSKK